MSNENDRFWGFNRPSPPPTPPRHAEKDVPSIAGCAPAESRREIYLIFKEAVNNVARHSSSTAASVSLDLGRGMLTLRVSDNGKGFDPAAADGGHGMASMRERARRLGAELAVSSLSAGGAEVVLRAPLR